MKEKFDPVAEEDKARRAALENLSPGEQEAEKMKLHERALVENAPTFSEKIKEAPNEDIERAIGIVEAVKAEGGLALVVGGWARDEAMRRFGYKVETKDIDIEVYGIEFEALENILKNFGEPNIVGASFGVIKLGNLDISIPRRDSKVGPGHKGFTVEGDPDMPIQEAARRRDLTINALAYDPVTGEIIDKYGGLDDIQHKVLRATNYELFKDDPLRVLRVMQFAGRFGFSVEEKTRDVCRSIDLSELPKERIGEEWVKLLTKSPKPSIGLEAGAELGVISKLHPELAALESTPQDPEWHPEGNVWTHTKLVVDAAAGISFKQNLSDEEHLVLLLAALCHDLGKPGTTTKNETGRVISHQHAEKGLEPTEHFLDSINISKNIVAKVLPLVKEHLWPVLNKDASDAAVRRLAVRLAPATIQELVWVSESDHRGRDVPWDGFPAGVALLERAKALAVEMSKEEPILMGRHLVELGLKPGPQFGRILREVYDAQLDGRIKTAEEAKKLVQEIIKN